VASGRSPLPVTLRLIQGIMTPVITLPHASLACRPMRFPRHHVRSDLIVSFCEASRRLTVSVTIG
jgi:hypothetical protein